MIGRILALDPADDLVGAADRIAWAKASHVIVIMPAEARWSALDFVRLQRAADAQGVALAIVTADKQQQMMAREAGLPAFSTVAEAQARAWERGEAPEPPRRLRPPRRFVPNSLARFFPRRRPWARLLAAALTLITLLMVSSLAFIAIH